MSIIISSFGVHLLGFTLFVSLLSQKIILFFCLLSNLCKQFFSLVYPTIQLSTVLRLIQYQFLQSSQNQNLHMSCFSSARNIFLYFLFFLTISCCLFTKYKLQYRLLCENFENSEIVGFSSDFFSISLVCIFYIT